MSAHVLLNLLNKLGTRSLFPNELKKLNNTRARMLDSIYHITLKILNNHIFSVETSRFCHLFAALNWTPLCYPLICKP